ncbi:type II toxin-antitoxin system HicA family toxin [Corynebacterium hindlerae]|uniref:Type II toxin-antitoxin system HicA family toxin n=1 Tax=Corynebacterium hindlerae TaxID=699041 RepID=A0A7G5FCF5_9CORY|nr:type II toxin-antitoxin system HicA family toxin [Corynebacterium hindlerae]QMV84296.1 type II toxin-antitoxin system HicA family toxin [Corynebacterium hindlerae]QTH59822.1 type II toxin-antitoxin system HicA family toxin [Corynebacterium hindlerae]
MTKPMKYRDLVKLLIDAGFTFARQGKGDHEVWEHPSLNRPVVLTQTRELSPAVTRHELKAINEVRHGN